MEIFLFRDVKRVLKCGEVQQVDTSGGLLYRIRQGISCSAARLLPAKGIHGVIVVR
jgi:hypothetical protein